MKRNFKSMILATAAVAMGLSSCSLEEDNPGGFTMKDLAENSTTSYRTLINQCYFGMERFLYGTDGFMELTEAGTDLWTYTANKSTGSTQYFWFYAGASPNTTYTNGIWNAIYDGIAGCNEAINLAPSVPYKNDTLRNTAVAEAHFMRAVYYFNAVEQFGAVTMTTQSSTVPNFSPTRTEPLTIYRELIIPDLEFAVEWLEKGTDATTTQPTKKAALGMLAKACLQTKEYGTDEYLTEGLQAAKKLIDDCEGGGTSYGAYMYPTYDEVFLESNNFNNKEALWKHRWYAGSEGHGSSNGNWKLNRNDEKFLCSVTQFGAIVDNLASRQTWEDCRPGIFMPSQHLLSLYVQSDGTLDPRFHKSFTTQWKANTSYTWNKDAQTKYGKDASVVGVKLNTGDTAIKFAMPQDSDYSQEVANKSTSHYLLVDYKDVYNDAKKNVINQNGSSENLFSYFYPSLNKHNSSNYFIANDKKSRIGNLNGTFIMRMAEIYLIAAELDIYLNGGANAKAYINKVKARAGAELLNTTPTLRDVLDERGRELCGEYCRFYDLKRMGLLKDNTYLNETHPDLGQYFKPEYALRPISSTFTDGLENGSEYQNPGY